MRHPAKMDPLADLEARGLVPDSTDREALRARIRAGPIGVYYGADPSSDSLQIGSLVGGRDHEGFIHLYDSYPSSGIKSP